eukprot:scaffold127242_cov25-Tisochrysis_lutea.AAC.2
MPRVAASARNRRTKWPHSAKARRAVSKSLSSSILIRSDFRSSTAPAAYSSTADPDSPLSGPSCAVRREPSAERCMIRFAPPPGSAAASTEPSTLTPSPPHSPVDFTAAASAASCSAHSRSSRSRSMTAWKLVSAWKMVPCRHSCCFASSASRQQNTSDCSTVCAAIATGSLALQSHRSSMSVSSARCCNVPAGTLGKCSATSRSSSGRVSSGPGDKAEQGAGAGRAGAIGDGGGAAAAFCALLASSPSDWVAESARCKPRSRAADAGAATDEAVTASSCDSADNGWVADVGDWPQLGCESAAVAGATVARGVLSVPVVIGAVALAALAPPTAASPGALSGGWVGGAAGAEMADIASDRLLEGKLATGLEAASAGASACCGRAPETAAVSSVAVTVGGPSADVCPAPDASGASTSGGLAGTVPSGMMAPEKRGFGKRGGPFPFGETAGARMKESDTPRLNCGRPSATAEGPRRPGALIGDVSREAGAEGSGAFHGLVLDTLKGAGSLLPRDSPSPAGRVPVSGLSTPASMR